jgi:hypothetical protein
MRLVQAAQKAETGDVPTYGQRALDLSDSKAVTAFLQHRAAFNQALLNVLNKHWAVVTKQSKAVYVERAQVAASGRMREAAAAASSTSAAGASSTPGMKPAFIMRQSEQAFRDVYINRSLTLWEFCPKGAVRVRQQRLQVADWWVKHPDRREYDQIVSDPSLRADPRNLNLWQGMAITEEHCNRYRSERPDYQQLAQPFFDHIRLVWCRGDPDLYSYVCKWFALTIQKPWVKIGVALVVVGAQGAGKGVVVTDFMGRIVGEAHYAHIMGVEELLGAFNAATTVANKLKLVDECTWAGNKKEAGRLKGMITEPQVFSQAKYADGKYLDCYSNFIFFSNDPYAVSIEPNDRRFCSLETDNRFSGVPHAPETIAHFTRLRAVPVRAVASVLYEADLSNFNHRQFPHSEFRQTQQTLSLPTGSVLHWLLGCLNRGQLPGSWSLQAAPETREKRSDIPEWERRRVKSEVYDDYRQQAGPHPKPNSVFWKELQALFAQQAQKLVTKQADRKVASVQTIRFPPLELCKRAFRIKMGNPKWEFDSDEPPAAGDGMLDEEKFEEALVAATSEAESAYY